MNHSCIFFLSKQKELHALHGLPNEKAMGKKVNASILRKQGYTLKSLNGPVTTPVNTALNF